MGAPVLCVRGQCLSQLRWFLPYNRECHQRHAGTFVYPLNLGNMLIYCFQLLSQLTTRIRLYGGDCNQTALVVCFFSLGRVLVLTILAGGHQANRY